MDKQQLMLRSLKKVDEYFGDLVKGKKTGIHRWGSSGENIIHIYPNVVIKDFLGRKSIENELTLLNLLLNNVVH